MMRFLVIVLSRGPTTCLPLTGSSVTYGTRCNRSSACQRLFAGTGITGQTQK